MSGSYVTFVGANILALLGWLLLLSASRLPRWAGRLAGIGIPLLLSIVYMAAFIVSWPFAGGGFDSPENLSRLFSQPQMAMTGWVHYLAFDLFIGGWQARRAEQQGMAYFLLAPCLILTMLVGPIGLLVFFGVSVLSHGKQQRNPGRDNAIRVGEFSR